MDDSETMTASRITPSEESCTASSEQSAAVVLTKQSMKNLSMCGVLTLPNKSTVLTMDWSSDGQTLITCSDDKCLHIFSLSHHDTKQFVLSDKHGATTVPNLSPVERNAAQIEQSALGEQEKAQDPQTPDSPRSDTPVRLSHCLASQLWHWSQLQYG
eukprot:GHVQ01026245.1.p3 GENE.GHVQ01026245.1~~GHVQ01026245.1.p3  ORF type:complete len:157 (+),score=16.16 GHVQ01026245.1:282-752(+)